MVMNVHLRNMATYLNKKKQDHKLIGDVMVAT